MKLENQVLLKFDVENKNGRIYRKSEFTRIRNEKSPSGDLYEWTLIEDLNGYHWCRQYLWAEKHVSDKRTRVDKPGLLLGEIGYPEDFEVSLSRVSHSIKNVRIEEDLLIGDIEILNTSSGNNLKKMIEEGLEIVFRPRAVGVINENKEVTVDKLLAFDAIPATTDSFNIIENENTSLL